jgi:hypothetical protein
VQGVTGAVAMGELVIMYAYPGTLENFERLSLFWDRTAQIRSISGQWRDFFSDFASTPKTTSTKVTDLELDDGSVVIIELGLGREMK